MLKDSETKYRLIVDRAADIIATLDMDLRFTYISPSIKCRRGFTVEEAMAQTIDQVMTPESFQKALKLFEAEMAQETAGAAEPGRVRILELEEYRKDGSTVWVEVSLSFLRDETGKPVEILTISRDISDRKQADTALREGEESLRALVEGLPDVVMRFDRDGRHLFVSENVSELVDIQAAGFIGKTHREMDFPEAQCRSWEQAIRGVFDSGRPFETEITVDGKQGQTIHNWRLFPERDAQGAIRSVLSLCRNITAHRRAEKDYRMLFQEMLDGFALHEIICDGQGNPADYRFIAVNPAFERITGLKAENITGKTVLEVMPGTERHWIESYGRVALTGESVFFENYSAEINKYFEVTAFRPAPNQFACIFSDITERKKAEAGLRENRRFLADLIEHSGALIFVKSRDGHYEMVNRKWEEVTGLMRNEVLGRTDDELFPGPIGRQFRLNDLEVMETDAMIEREEVLEDSHGKRFFISIKFPVRSEAGTVRGVCGMSTDITRRKQDEAEKQKLQDQLTQAQKMEAVGRLAGGVAHDFNNMLTIIMGYAEMSMDTLQPSDPLHANIQEIISAGLRSTDVVRQLLAFARKQTIAPRILDLNETIANILKMLRRLIGEDIDLLWQAGAGLWPVKMDPSQVDQILANLAVNARDAIRDVGKLTIETGNVSFDAAYCETHSGFEPGDYILLAVSDDGCGMDKETLANIFEPFFTTKEFGKGTGLGLSTIYGIVRQNNGFINVYSEVGIGTTFRIYIPRCQMDDALAVDAVLSAGIPTGEETVLLVEDQEVILKMTKTMLERLGYRVLAANAPGEAICIAEGYAGEIHLLLTDVVMPEMHGRDLAKHLSGRYPKLKNLFMSGYTADVIAHHGVLDRGMNFIQKPFSRRDLAVQVRKALD